MDQNKVESKSALLVRYIGIERALRQRSQLTNEDFQSLLHLAEQNKIPLLFLQTVPCNRNIQPILSHYEERYKSTLNLIAYIAELFEKVKVPYALFKTLKPFPYTPSDIDVLLWSEESLLTAAETLKNRGCVPLEKDNYGLTIFSPNHKMNIDLTTQIAASGFIYVDKKLLFDHLCRIEVNEVTVQTLKPSAELLVVAAHGVFKEQTYTLSDYYTFAMFSQHWKEATELAEDFYLERVFNMTLKMTKRVTANSFGSTSGKECEMPKKHDLAFLVVAFLKKTIEDPASRRSLHCMARSVSNPAFCEKIMQHATRKTY